MPTASSAAWRSRDVLRVTALVAAVCISILIFWVGREIFFLAFMGVLFGLTLSAAVDRVQRFKIPRGLAAPLLLFLVLGFIAGLTSFAAPQVASQLRDVKDQVPEVVTKVRGWVDSRVGGVTKLLSDSTSSKAAPADSTKTATPRPDVGTVGKAFFAFFSSTLSAVGGFILIVFMTLFIAIEPQLYQRGLMHLVPHRNRKRLKEVLDTIGGSLRRWLITQMIAMVVIGVVTGLAMWALGIRGAIGLGVIAGLLEFIPFVGPIASAVPAVAMGLLDSPEKAVWVAVAFTLIQQAEGHLLIPLLMKDSLDLPPVLTILSQALMATVFGFLGLLVAVPLLALVMVAVRLLYVEDVVGDSMEVAT